MSVIAVTLHWNGATGLAKSGDEREFTAVYRAVTNDPRDGPQVIIDHFRDSPSLPFLDYSYAYGNDVQVNAFCDRIDPRRVDGSNVVWEVSLHYAPAEGDESSEPTEGFDKDGNRTTDPLAFHDEIAISKAQFTIPVYRAKIWGGLRGRALIRRPVGTEEVPRNSAGVVFDPPLEMDHSRTVLRLTKRMAAFPMEESEEYQDAINSDWFQITRNIPSFSATFSQYQLKMQNIGGSFQRQNGVFFWRVDYEMHIGSPLWLASGCARSRPGGPRRHRRSRRTRRADLSGAASGRAEIAAAGRCGRQSACRSRCCWMATGSRWIHPTASRSI